MLSAKKLLVVQSQQAYVYGHVPNLRDRCGSCADIPCPQPHLTQLVLWPPGWHGDK